MSVAAGIAAWLGASIVLLSDGRRGLALGLAVLGAGLAGVALDAGHAVEAVALAAGGLVAGALRLRDGPEGWRMVPPGSTPRLILSIATGLFALYIAAGVVGGDDAALRFAVLAVLSLLALRFLLGADAPAANTAASGVALTLGAGALLVARGAPEAACIIGALVAAGLQAIPRAETHGA